MMMKKLIVPAMTEVRPLEDINQEMLVVFEQSKKLDPEGRIGYVSGIITSKGRDKISIYIKRLAKYTEHVRSQQPFPIFSPTDIFTKKIYDQTMSIQLPGQEFQKFW